MSYTRILEEDGRITYELGGNTRFQQPALHEAEFSTQTIKDAENAIAILDILIENSQKIDQDQDLSAAGKLRKLEPMQSAFVDGIAAAWHTLERDESKNVIAAEAALYALPELDPTHSVMAIEDREIRDYVRTLDIAKAAELTQGGAAERVQLAILRSPIPQNDALVTAAREAWQSSRREQNPAEAARIAATKANVEWGKRAIAQAAGLGMHYLGTGWSKDRVLNQVMLSGNPFSAKGHGAFGFNAADVAMHGRRLEATGYSRNEEGLYRKA